MNPFRSLASSLVGALFGAALFIGSFVLHYWNERRAVMTERSLEEGRDNFVRGDVKTVDPANEDRLIHISGDATAPAPLVDPITRFAIPALLLERKTEMYQWVEQGKHPRDKRKSDLRHEKKWLSQLKDSDRFHDPAGHENPKAMTIPGGRVTVPEAKIGAFRVSGNLLRRIDPSDTFIPRPEQLASLPPPIKDRARISGQHLYLGADPTNPAIGDERILFPILPPGPVSFIARQTGDTLGEFHTSNGRALLLAEAGNVSAESMFQHAFSRNTTLTWILRFVGTFVMFLGMRLLIEPLTKVTDWIPLIGNVIDFGVTLASGAIALIGSAITIAIAWFIVRPFLSILLVACAIGIVLFIRRSKNSEPPPMPRAA